MRTGLFTAAVFLTSASAALAVEPIELEEVASGFTAPIHLEEPNDGTGRLFLVDQVGTIWIIMPDGAVLDEPFLDIADRRSEEQTAELQSRADLVCRLLLDKKKSSA